MKTYTLTEIAELLETDPKTLRRWVALENYDLSKQGSKYDSRIKWLSEEQAAQIAKAHAKLWPPRPKPAQAQAEATGLTGAVSLLREQVGELREDHVSEAQWRETVRDLYEQLGSTWEIIKHMQVELKDLRDWRKEQESKPKAGRKPKAGQSDQGEAQAQGED
jgi:hypothetical protein